MKIQRIVSGHYVGDRKGVYSAFGENGKNKSIMFSIYSKDFQPEMFQDRQDNWVVVTTVGIYNPRVKPVNKYFATKAAAVEWLESPSLEQESIS
jgi:hypothetical protein